MLQTQHIPERAAANKRGCSLRLFTPLTSGLLDGRFKTKRSRRAVFEELPRSESSGKTFESPSCNLVRISSYNALILHIIRFAVLRHCKIYRENRATHMVAKSFHISKSAASVCVCVWSPEAYEPRPSRSRISSPLCGT